MFTPGRKAIFLGGASYLPFSDGFGVNGALGSPWTGATWTVSGGMVTNSPTLNGELASNVEFTTNTTGWSAGDGATLTRRDYTSSPNIAPTGGADNFGLEVASGGNASSAGISNTITVTAGNWHRFSCRAYSPSANTATNAAGLGGSNIFSMAGFYKTVTENAWTTLVLSGRALTAATTMQLRCNSATAGDLAHHDAASCQQITLATMFATVGNCSPNVDISVKITRSTRAAAGLVLGLNNTAAPTYFLLAYLSPAGNAVLDKCVNGTYTNLINTAITYVAGAVLRVVKSGVSVSLYYNGAQVGTTQTLTAGADDTIINGTRHGMMSTDATVSFDDFSVDKKKVG